jgi:hypothetical protein
MEVQVRNCLPALRSRVDHGSKSALRNPELVRDLGRKPHEVSEQRLIALCGVVQ